MADPQQHRLIALDHVNIRTARVDALAAFYCDILGLSRGQRPPFPFGGAWLYCGDSAVVHLVEAPAPAGAVVGAVEPSLSHFAFRATGMTAFIARLREAGVPHQVAHLPGSRVAQVNLHDLDGNALHVDFGDAVAGASS